MLLGRAGPMRHASESNRHTKENPMRYLQLNFTRSRWRSRRSQRPIRTTNVQKMCVGKSRHSYRILGVFLALYLSMVTSPAPAGGIAEGYCILRHPLEAIFVSQKTTCEQQHVIQRQCGGCDDSNIIWINTTEHHYTDRSRSKPWQESRPWTPEFLYSENLERAYMMGTYANGYHFLVSDYKRGSHLTLSSWDGVSHITYLVAGWANLVTKEMSYLGYLIRRLYTKGETFSDAARIIDAFLSLSIDVIEMSFGTIYGILGILVGVVLHPIETLTNIPGGILLVIETVFTAAWNTFGNFVSLFTLGYIDISK